MANSAIITGCNGFVGRYLAARLMRDRMSVFGVDIQDNATQPLTAYKMIDISDGEGLARVLSSWKVDEIYHLAAMANPKSCQENPDLAVRTNINGAASIYNYCLNNPECKTLIVGSSEQYAKKDDDPAVYSEEDKLEPHNIYGVTKMCAETLGKAYVSQYGLSIFFTRSFNHTGAGQSDTYVVSSFARQCAEITLMQRSPSVEVGNIDIGKDFSDVRDVVNAYIAILRTGKKGEAYNVGSGKPTSLREILSMLISLTGRSDISIDVCSKRMRSKESGQSYSKISKIIETTGWSPKIPMMATLSCIYNYWISFLSAKTY